MATSKWTDATSETNLLTTELNSLSNGSNKITTAAISNDASDELYLYGRFRMHVAGQGSARTAGANVAMYLLPEVNGTYAFGGDSLDPPSELLNWQFSYDAATTARDNVSNEILLPNTDFYVLVINNTGQDFASSGNTLSVEKFNVQSVS